MSRRSNILFLLLACLASSLPAQAQRPLPPPIFGPDTVTSAKPPDLANTPMPPADLEAEQEVIATSKTQLPPISGGDAEIAHIDDNVHPAGFQGAKQVGSTLGPGSAAVAVGVEGPRQVPPGEAMECVVVVRNFGTHVAAQVDVELTLPTGARLLSVAPEPVSPGPKLLWKLGNLEAGGERRFKLDIQTPLSGEMVLAPSLSFAAAVGLRTRLERPTFAITQTMPDSIHRGDVVPIVLDVTNKGTAPLTNLVVHENLPDGLSHTVGKVLEVKIARLDPGETHKLDLKPQAVRLGRFVNIVEATADGGIKTTSRRPLTVAEAGLTMRLDGPDRLAVGKEGDLRLVLGNTSNQATPAAKVVVQVPDGLDVIASSPGATSDSPHAISWALPALDPGTAHTATLRLRPRFPGAWNVEATASMGSEVSITQQHGLHAEGIPSLVVEARVDEEPLAVGSETTLEVKVHNNGTFPAQDLHVTVHSPDTILLDEPTGPAPGMVEGALATWAPLPELGVHREAVYRCRVHGLHSGNQHVQVDVQARGVPQPLHEEAHCRVLPAELPVSGLGVMPPAEH